MDIKDEYNEFYKTAKYKENREYYKKLKDVIFTMDDPKLYKIEDYIRSVRSTKTRFVYAYKDFYDFLKRKGEKVSSNLPKNYDTQTRRLELIKYLQTPRTREDILNEFLINERTFDIDKKELEKGIEVCGVKLIVKISSYNRNGNNTIDNEKFVCSCHPFFVALNATELYLITKVIPDAIKNNNELYRAYSDILSKIYPQLSDYALKMIDVELNCINNETNYLWESETLKNDTFKRLVYCLKQEREFTILYNKDGIISEVTGFVRDITNNPFYVETKTDKVYIRNENFIDVKDFFDNYK